MGNSKKFWLSLERGDEIWIRPKRVAGDARRVRVGEVLQANLNGPGFIDQEGAEIRSFYFEILDSAPRVRVPRAVAADSVSVPRPKPTSAKRVRWASLPEAERPDVVLTPHQLSVASLAARGLSPRKIAAALSISKQAVRLHLRQVRQRYAAAGRPIDSLAALVIELQREIPATGRYGVLVRHARPGRAAQAADSATTA